MYHLVLKAFLNYLLRKEGYLLAKQDAFGNMYVPDYNGEQLIERFYDNNNDGITRG
jgi:hypothetical protein